MGIFTSIAKNIGIPLAIAVGAGLLITAFKDQIVGGISSGASTVGQAITSPFGALLSGLQEGLSNIPSTFTIPFPTFNFTLGGFNLGGNGSDDSPFGENPSGESGIGGSDGILDPSSPSAFAQALENLRNNTLGLLDFTKLFPVAEGSLFTLLEGDKRFPTDTLNPALGKTRQFLSRTKIVELFPQAIGLFDILGTQSTEFIPLTAEQVAELSGLEFGGVRLSGQLFEEFSQDTIF